ncbi:VOC family protein [Azospirillum sp. ST 5-10]|uniref:VOC family protein n=1 Tax=unclassified Azospirillum TaxID=2630922 RepID=UPI003F4A07E2
MRLAHVALWTRDLDNSARFWADHFGAEIGAPYRSARREGFVSRFVRLPGGAAIELMTGPWVEEPDAAERSGWAHVAVAVGSAPAVDALAARLAAAGLLVSPPRTTGDGFYEAVAQAPDGALVEITA